MTLDDASGLVALIARAWPRAELDIDLWIEDLSDLDAGTAGTALVRLRRTLDYAPSIARFRNECKALHTATGDRNQSTPACLRCDGTGWIAAVDLIRGEGDHATRYRQVEACPICAAGVHAAELQTTITKANRTS